MRSRRRQAVAAAAAIVLGLVGVPSAAQAAPPASAPHQLANALIPALDQLTDLGPVPDGEVLQVGVHLAEDQAAEQAAARAIYEPGSPTFHHYLSVDQYVARFGLDPALTDDVAGQLRAHGLEVVYRSKPGTLLQLRGTAAQVEQTFGTPLHNFRTASGATFRANTVAPTVPGAVDAVRDLETLSEPKVARTGTTLPSQACTATTSAGLCAGALTPQDLWAVYDQPAGNRGAGRQLAVIGAGQYKTVIDDLRGFEDAHNLRHMKVRVITSADDQTYADGEGEWAMDSAATTGMAPDADLLTLYFSKDLGSTDSSFSAFADDSSPGAPLQANYSVGGCESVNFALGTITTDEPIFRQQAMEGKTQFVSTGDTGGSCTAVAGNGFLNTGAPQVEWPSSSDWVMAVGGTELYTDGDPSTHRVLEKAWDYTGGGSSALVPEPTWQSHISYINHPCAADAINTPMTTGSICRGLPDVTALSGDISVLAGEVPTKTTTGLANGYTDWEGATQDAAGNVTHGSATVDGGTSLSTPLWVGMWTRMQAASTDAHGLGFAPAALYAIGLDAVKDPTAFFDISVGQNGQNQAVPRTPTVDPTGWDYVSGLGAPDVGVLMQDLAGTTANLKPVLPGDTAYTVTESAAPPSSCPPNGSIPDPAADTAATTTDTQPDAFDLTHVGYVLGADGQTISISDTVTDLADSTDPALLFENQFTFENVDYYANFERDQPGATETLTLNTLNGTTFEFEQKLVMSGGFDDATNTVTGSFTIAAFNAAVHPAVNMARGDRFLALSTQTSGETDPFAADTASTSCPYVIGGVAADPTVPEAPSLPLLLGAVLPAGALVLWRRRRAARA